MSIHHRPPSLRRERLGALLLVGLLLLALVGAGCGGDDEGDGGDETEAERSADAVPVWPAPRDPMQRTVEAGLTPERKEFLIYHAHAHLDVFVEGKPVVVPAGVGINIDDPRVHRFKEPDGSPSYGGITRPCGKPCISPLHTHDTTGILHTESRTPGPTTLGEFFVEWAVPLSSDCVGSYCRPESIAFYVNGQPYTEDPRDIKLTDRKEIAIVIGQPPEQIPETADFSGV
jgi:hypothetical protein